LSPPRHACFRFAGGSRRAAITAKRGKTLVGDARHGIIAIFLKKSLSRREFPLASLFSERMYANHDALARAYGPRGYATT
jgi:hypothetical protein